MSLVSLITIIEVSFEALNVGYCYFDLKLSTTHKCTKISIAKTFYGASIKFCSSFLHRAADQRHLLVTISALIGDSLNKKEGLLKHKDFFLLFILW